MKRIVVLGSINTDLVVRTHHFPVQGETVIGSDLKTVFGGKGANQAIAAARLGAQVSMAGRVGNDPYGKDAIDNFRLLGVDTKFVTEDPSSPTGMAFVLIDASGNNSIVVSPGANGKVDQADLDAVEHLFSEETILVTQFEISMPAITAGINMAKARGSHIILNPAPALIPETGLLENVDTLILNETELTTLSNHTDPDQGLSVLLESGVQQIVLTLGEKGCILVSKEQIQKIPAHYVKVVDTTGAGDAFVGAFATAISEERDFLTAGLWGNAAGAILVTSLGAQSSLLTRERIFKIIGGQDSP